MGNIAEVLALLCTAIAAYSKSVNSLDNDSGAISGDLVAADKVLEEKKKAIAFRQAMLATLIEFADAPNDLELWTTSNLWTALTLIGESIEGDKFGNYLS